MKANPNFDYLHEKLPSQRITLLQGGTRSGKTYATVYFLIDYCLMYSGMEIDICRDTFTALKATAWKDFKDVLISCNLYNDKNHNKTDHSYLLNGNTINYYGADTPDKIHGRSRDILWINEAHQFPQETIDQLFPRTRYKIIADYNPALGLEHWLDPYIEKYPPLITTYKDNPFLTTEQVEDIESRKSNNYWWKIYGSGERADREGAIFTNFEIGNFDTSLPYAYGQDYGFTIDPTTLVKVAVDEKKKIIYCDEQLYSTQGMGVDSIFNTNLNLIHKKNDLIIADSAEPRLIDDLKRKGLNIQGCIKGQGSVSAGISKMQDYKIVITPNSFNIRKELSNYVWNDKKAGIPVDAFNHCFIGNTLITTKKGLVRIDEIEVGELVLTTNGYKKVLKVFNNGVQQVNNYLIHSDINSLSLTATKSHLVKTDKGWMEISKLQSGQMVYLHKNLKGNNTFFTQKKDIFQGVINECILQCINFIMEIFQKTIMYIIQTVTRGITKLQTYNLFKKISIYKNTAKNVLIKIKNGLKIFTQKALKKLPNGISQKKVLNGTLNSKKKTGNQNNGILKYVLFVIKNTRHHSQKEVNTAIKIARLKHLEVGESRMEKVYDIMVEDNHEYFANGLLVHNCIDAIRYAFDYLARPKHSTVLKKNSLI